MKFKNIIMAGLAVLFFNSCSKDKEHVPETGEEAQVSIMLKTSGSVRADADEELSGEANINNAGVAVFYEDGSWMLGEPFWKEIDGKNNTTLLNVPAMSQKALIVILVNCPADVFSGVTTYANLQAKLVQLSDQTQDNLTMSSQVIRTDNALLAGDNYLGYSEMGEGNINGIDEPVEVTRLASRIDLAKVMTSFAGSKLAGRTVRIDRITILNEKKASHFFSENYWGVVMAEGNLGNSEPTAIDQSLTDNAPVENIFRRYVMENDGAASPTQIQIRATLEESPGYLSETKNFTATVNLQGVLVQGQAHKYIKRNHVYRLTITFGKESFQGIPDLPTPPPVDPNGTLDVQVEVVGWGPVTQDVVIE